MRIEPRSTRMELLTLAFVVYAIWNMTGGFALQPQVRAVIAAVCILGEVIIGLMALGLVHPH